MHSLTPILASSFFDSLRAGYPGQGNRSGFDEWFRQKARENRMAWIYRDDAKALAALCIYHAQVDEVINDNGERLEGKALKLCTLKVGESVRGRKIGELFLKAAFKYASENACENIFIHANAERHDYLINLLRDFGFKEKGSYQNDVVLVKQHPVTAPQIGGAEPLDYVRDYFPHFQASSEVQKFVVPIQPEFHDTLFPDYQPMQPKLFSQVGDVGNAIKLAYICHAPISSIKPGDVLLFYRTKDEKSITTVGVVERFSVSADAAQIASIVSRRTVYSIDQIADMAKKPTKVILFRLISHLPSPVSYDELNRQQIIAGPIQSIRRVSDDAFSKILTAARW
jgi:GNAT superfamily N-acetyltransferase